MPAPLERTRTPGVYKRGDKPRYVVVWRDAHGKQHKESVYGYDAARELKSKRDQQARSREAASRRRTNSRWRRSPGSCTATR
jgi:hypothetical protein